MFYKEKGKLRWMAENRITEAKKERVDTGIGEVIIKKDESGYYIEYDWDYEGESSWEGPFRSKNEAINWYLKRSGVK